MPLLPALTREQIAPELHQLWDQCEATVPEFRHLWSTMAHSPTIFRYIWGELLALKRESPVAARHFELAVVTTSTLTSCNYCVSHHTPLAAQAGCGSEQLDYVLSLRLEALPEDYNFPVRSGFDTVESLVIDLAYFLVWAGIYAPQQQVPPRHLYRLKHRLFTKLQKHFPPRQIEELTWRIAQCVAFNWHNDFLELDIEADVTPLLEAASGD
jgi:AhpD family alkylhydroperoxidase